MERVYVATLIAVLVVAGVAAYELAYVPTQTAKPPQVVLVYNGSTYSGRLDSYCWPNAPANGTCTDRIRLGGEGVPPAINVAKNTSVSFRVIGASNPITYHVGIGTNHTVIAIKDVSSSLPITYQAGYYYISAFAKWSDGTGVGYTFEIDVS